MLVPVEISSFAIEPTKNTPLVVLRELSGGRTVAIPVDHTAANAIAMHSLHTQADKPFTIDLVRIAVKELGGVVCRVIINDVSEGVFMASVAVRAGAALKFIDCRPGEAIALAVKCDAPIFVRDTVFFKLSSERGLSEEEQLRAHIRAIDTVDFGRYVLE